MEMSGPTVHDPNHLYLMAELRQVDLLLRRRALLLQRQSQGQASDDSLLGLYISEDEAHKILASDLLRGDDFADSGADELAQPLQTLEAESEALAQKARSLAKETPLRLDRLTQLFGLDDFERKVVLICLLPEVSLDYERLFGYLQNDVTKRQPTLDLLLRLLSPSLAEGLALHHHFSAQAPLIRHQIIVLLAGANGQESPFIARFLKLGEGILSYLLGHDDLDRRLLLFTEVVRPEFRIGDLVLPDNLRQRLERLVAQRQDSISGLVCCLYGQPGAGRRMVAKAVCGELGIPLLLVDIDKLLDNASELPPETAIQLLFREAKLCGAATLWQHFGLFQTNPTNRILLEKLLTEATTFSGLTFLSGEKPWEPAGSFSGTFVSLEIAAPDATQRLQLWKAYLNGSLPSPSEDVLGALAETFRLTAGQICDAVATAHRVAAQRYQGLLQPTLDDLYTAARRRSRHRLDSLARPVELRFTWKDIVLPKDQMDRLKEICAHIRHRSLVYEEWGFGRTLPANKGLSILFAGPSGTGKTMAATIVARELGLEMYRIDLSTVVSKYIGETEKNLERIFQEGQDSNAILFFDEADALFGKRSEVRDSHDRYANIEIAYLLQRMEDYSGVVILATNLRRNLDEAFTRRLDFVVEFPMPEEAERLLIWRKVLPPQAPLAEDVDLALLARQYKLSGGNIRNAAVAAAFLAAAEGWPIGMEHLLRAVRREHQKMGKLMAEADLAPNLEPAKSG